MSNGYSGTTRLYTPLPLISEFSGDEQELFSRQIVFKHKLHVIKKIALGDPLRVSDSVKNWTSRVEVVPKVLDIQDCKGVPFVFHFAGVEYVLADREVVAKLIKAKLLDPPAEGTVDHYPEEIELRGRTYVRADRAVKAI